MDTPPLIASNITGLLLTLTVLGSCFNNLTLIKDPQLKISLSLFFISFILNLVFSTLGWHSLAQFQESGDVKKLTAFGQFNITCSTFYILAFISQSFYSLRRTCMIYNLSLKLQILIPCGMTIIQAAIQYTNSAFWAVDMQTYFGKYNTPNTVNATLASILYLSLTEPVYFALLQFKIVQSALLANRNKAPNPTLKVIGLCIEAFVRLALYICSVVLAYCSVSNYVDQIAYWSFTNVLPTMIPLIFLTDVNRFQAALGKGQHSAARSDQGTGSGTAQRASAVGPRGSVVGTPKRGTGGDMEKGNKIATSAPISEEPIV